jgi:hypothetical protein
VLGLGLMGCLRLGAVLAFLDGWVVAWDLPLLWVSTMVRVRVWRKMSIRVRLGFGDDGFGMFVDDDDDI